MISLRELNEKDAPLMLEWMHDPDIQRSFKKNMLNATMDDVKKFCINAKIPHVVKNGDSIHFAVVNTDDDEYLGTISLKDVDTKNRSAEYAITMRNKAHGRGYARKATGLLLEKAFNEFDLHRVYLNVFSDNKKAIKLYEKCGFVFEGEFREHFNIDGKFKNWKWYGMLKKEYREENFF